MIGYVHGTVVRLWEQECLVDVHGIGYRVWIPASTRATLKTGEEALLYTHLQIRDDGWFLYGFATEAEYALHELLCTVTGIGPKVAVGIVAAIRPEDFYTAIRTQNKAVLMNLPGIGKKSAERLLLELKDKVGEWPLDAESADTGHTPAAAGAVAETVTALCQLGYTEAEVGPVVMRLSAEHTDTGRLLTAALHELGKERGT